MITSEDGALDVVFVVRVERVERVAFLTGIVSSVAVVNSVCPCSVLLLLMNYVFHDAMAKCWCWRGGSGQEVKGEEIIQATV